MRKSRLRKLAAAGILMIGFCCSLGVLTFVLSDKSATERDFIEYWAAEHQLIHGGNPYDVLAIYQIERSAGLNDGTLKVTFSPPIVFLLALPLAFIGAKTGLIFWLLIQVFCFLISLRILWILYGRRESPLFPVCVLFSPVIACLMAGQISIFILLGIILFLYFHESKPFLAGAVLLPCVLKPHLLLPFAAALVLWIIIQKSYRILAGFTIALLSSYLLTLCLDRNIWSQYAQLRHSTRVMQVFIPTLSAGLRFLVARNEAWLQFAPAALGCCWALWYCWTRRYRWNWIKQGLVLLLVSLICAPYAFFFDETILLPVVLAGIYSTEVHKRTILPFILICLSSLAELTAGVRVISPYYLWTTLAWLLWYLYATRTGGAIDQTDCTAE